MMGVMGIGADNFLSLKVSKLMASLNVVDWTEINGIKGPRELRILWGILVVSLAIGAKWYPTMLLIVNGCTIHDGVRTVIR